MKIEYEGKWFPEAGDKVTVHHYISGTCSPHTVSRVEGGKVVIRACGMRFDGPRYFDTLPDEIYDDPKGSESTLTWSPKRKNWILSSWKGDRYPGVAEFGVWKYEPYLD